MDEEISHLYLKAPISALMWARNETAVLMTVSRSLRSMMKKLLPAETKTPSSVPQGMSGRIKNGINSSSGNHLFKNHMLKAPVP